jgi:hypothetical protein
MNGNSREMRIHIGSIEENNRRGNPMEKESQSIPLERATVEAGRMDFIMEKEFSNH